MNGTDKDSKIHDKYMREVKTARHLNNLELHASMQLTNHISVMKVMGGWIYYHSIDNWASFVPDKRSK